jgi:hypothetical protein
MASSRSDIKEGTQVRHIGLFVSCLQVIESMRACTVGGTVAAEERVGALALPLTMDAFTAWPKHPAAALGCCGASSGLNKKPTTVQLGERCKLRCWTVNMTVLLPW